MKKSTILLFTILAVFSCKKDEIATVTPRLKNCNIGYNHILTGLPGDTTEPRFLFTYADEKLVKSAGGFSPIPSGERYSNYLFTTDIYDSIHFDGNTISTYSKSKFDNVVHESSYNPIVYTLDSQKRITRLFTRTAYRPEGFNKYYTYTDQLITETNDNSQTTRIFHLENNNLVKVVSEGYNTQGILVLEKEIIFKDFDNKPNPFKNMYYVYGAFYRAFSENNYKSYTINEYFKMANGNFESIGTYSSYAMPIEYTADGYPKFGEYE
jgi:hypothetical protein